MEKEIKRIWGQEKNDIKPRPWEGKIKERQEKLRASWLELAQEVKETDKEFSDKIIAFVEKMPEIKTKREILSEKILFEGMKKENIESFLKDHPDLKNEAGMIVVAKQFAGENFKDEEKQALFLKGVIEGISQKRLRGEKAEAIQIQETRQVEKQNSKERTQEKDKDLER